MPLPAVRPHAPDAAERDTTPESLDGIRIVVVDDETDSRQAIAAVLEEWGAQVMSASNARDGPAIIDGKPTDVVISDIAMPVEDGYTFIRELRARPSGDPARLRALALTAYAGLEEPGRPRAAGYDGHLAKPADVRDLVTAVWRLMKRRPS